MRHVLFFIGRDRYALPLDAVREVVVAPSSWTRVPRAGEAVKGVMTLRGRVVPVVDLGRLLTRSATERRDGLGQVVLLEVGRRDLGLLVSEVAGIEAVVNLERVSGEAPLIKGVTRVGDHPASVLDVQALDQAVTAAFADT